MYESKTQPLLSRWRFLGRLIIHALAACLLVLGSLLLGMTGHLYFEAGTAWHDALVNAAMMLGGIGR